MATDPAKVDEEVVERIHQRTVVAQVMEKLRELISSGQYRVGDQIPTEQELARRFGIGRSSIREAIKAFTHLGILESRVPKGTFVGSRTNLATEALSWAVFLGDDEMYEVIELREVIEQRGFAALRKKLDLGDTTAFEALAGLREQVEEMSKAAAANSLEALSVADFGFHSAIVAESGNKLFRSIFSTLHHFTLEEIRSTYASMADLSGVADDHREIVEALACPDRENAVARHAAHFLRIKALLEARRSAGSQAGSGRAAAAPASG
ncbi:MAG: GntR family transcriptional regulator [Spirochaetota bacterium]